MTGSSPPLQFASLYVGDLHPDVTEVMLYEAFSSAGSVASCRVCRDSITRQSLCYGYVNFYNAPDAERALDTLNYIQIKGKPCRVMWSKRDPAARKNTSSNVFVKHLDESIDNKALHDTFNIFGNILSCKVATDASGKSRGYGFVHYEAEEAAKQAISRANGMQIGGKTVFVGPFLKREELVSEGTDKKENFTNLYVKNFPPSWDEAKITVVFSEHGELASSVVLTNNEGKRFALVNFKESTCAKDAVSSLHRRDVSSEGRNDTAEEKPTSPTAVEVKEAGGAQEETPSSGAVLLAEATGTVDAEAIAVAEAITEGEDAGDSNDDAQPTVEEKHPDHLLYVQRAQTKAERMSELNGKKDGRSGSGQRAPGVRLCVRNLSESMTSEKLRELFEGYGTVLNAAAKVSEGKCRGIGFVCMSSVTEATAAVTDMHLRVVDGKPLNVGLAERRRTRNERPDSGGKGAAAARAPKYSAVPPAGVPVMPAFPPFGMAPWPSMGCAVPPMAGGLGLPTLPGASQYLGWPFGCRPALPQWGTMPGPPQEKLHPTVSALLNAAAASQPTFPPLTIEMLNTLPPQAQKQTLGEQIFPLVSRLQPALAGKITGMVLELDNREILKLLQSDAVLRQKVDEAVKVLHQHR